MLADAAQEPGALGNIVFWEAVAALRRLARLKLLAACPRLRPRMSLARGKAEVLAAAVAEEREIRECRHPPSPKTGPHAPVTDRLPSPGLRVEPDPAASGFAPRAPYSP